MTPCDRLLAIATLSEGIKDKLRKEFARLDPVKLLLEIRTAQKVLADFATDQPQAIAPAPPDTTTFLQSLAIAWQDGEVRPTHRKEVRQARDWRTRADPFEQVWPTIEQWLNREPNVTAKELLVRLADLIPDAYNGTAQLRTLQRRVKEWRAEKAKAMVFAAMTHSEDTQQVRPNIIATVT